MIGLDTNVLLRFFVHDDLEQHAMAKRFMNGLSKETPGYVSAIVMVELIWTLKRLYGYHASQVSKVVLGLCTSAEIQVEYGIQILSVLAKRQNPEIIPDCIASWSGAQAGCTHTITFDRTAAKNVAGMELIS